MSRLIRDFSEWAPRSWGTDTGTGLGGRLTPGLLPCHLSPHIAFPVSEPSGFLVLPTQNAGASKPARGSARPCLAHPPTSPSALSTLPGHWECACPMASLPSPLWGPCPVPQSLFAKCSRLCSSHLVSSSFTGCYVSPEFSGLHLGRGSVQGGDQGH